MAIFELFEGSIVPDTSDFNGTIISQTSDRITIQDGDIELLVFGVFTFPGGGVSGTIDTITTTFQGSTLLHSVTALTLDAASVVGRYTTGGDPFITAELLISGNDTMMGSSANDVMSSGIGNDRLFGGGGNDILNGFDGADVLDGGIGADTMFGGLGNDFYFVDNSGDQIDGEVAYSAGGGIDTVRSFIDYVQPANIELVRLGNLADTANLNATGNDAPGTLVGNAGNNVLIGRGGNDQLNGNGGNDTITGNTGRDTVVGGEGADTFVYTAYADSRAGAANRDVVNGFQIGSDKIDLSQLDANTRTFGVDDAFTFIGSAGFSGNGASSAGELRLQSLGGPNAVLVEADHNGDGTADLQIFVNLTTLLLETDFIL